MSACAALLTLLVLPPAPRAAARLTVTSADSAMFAWGAVGDDSLWGTVARYDMRWSYDSLALVAAFSSADTVAGLPAPLPPGSVEIFVLHGLPPGRDRFYALRACDEVPNYGRVSNIVHWRAPAPPDTTAPPYTTAPATIVLEPIDQ